MRSAQQCSALQLDTRERPAPRRSDAGAAGRNDGMPHTKQEHIARGQEEVERMMSAGESFGAVELMIEEAQLNEDEKAALWLFAWSMRDKRAQRRETRGLLAYLSSVPQDLARSGS
jgi:hypothetical protein